MRLTHASVFSGIGGPEIAATMLGWDNAFHCEINEFGRKILEYWYPNSKSYEDITKTDFSEWRGKVDVLTGGFPCQPFSYAGQRRGAEDDRYLWPHMFRCIDQVRPTWVVAENVAGILTMVEQGEVSAMESQGTLFDEGDGVRRHRLVETFTLQRICDDLEGHGYEVQPVLVPACAVGAPHRRDRVFIIGHRRSVPQDPMRSGQLVGHDGEQGSERNERNAGARDSERLCRETSGIDTADSNGARQPSPDGESGRERETMDGGATCKSESDVVTDPAISGEGTPREGGGIEGCGRNANQQPCEWGATPEWSDGFYAILRSSANTSDNGLQHNIERGCQGEMPETERGRGKDGISEQTESTEAVGSGRVVADTKSEQGERLRLGQSEHCGEEQEQLGRGGCEDYTKRRDNSDTDCSLLQCGYCEGSSDCGQGQGTQPFHSKAGLGRWDYFPTQPPIHRGNDGLPFNVDDLAIPFSKWRTEALKAYGNAIVPQVMYEIFRAIEIVEQENL